MDYELDDVNSPRGDMLLPRNVKVEVLFNCHNRCTVYWYVCID